MADPRIVDAKFKDVVFHVAIPNKASPFGVTSQEITNERRLQISEKPLVDGAEVEDFGRKPRNFTAEVIFFGDNYLEQLKTFEAKLNEGSSGTLILPDLDEAVIAKYQKHNRKSSAQDGNCTMLSVSWIEDKNSKSLSAVFQAGALDPNSPTGQVLGDKTNEEKAVLVQESTASITDSINSTRALIENNSFLKQVNDLKGSITSQRQTIDLVSNLGRDTKTLILNTVSSYKSETESLKSSISGLLKFTDILKNDSSGTPTRYNTGLGLADFVAIGISSTTIVSGSAQVVVAAKPAEVVVQSFEDASAKFKASLAVIKDAEKSLQLTTQGQTAEISKSNVVLINSIQDLIKLLDEKPTRQVLTESATSLVEICFRNGIKIKDLDRVHKLNSQLDDILDVPRFTVINL
jgi:prophage DNA circulation protein